jgi:hypothetical protein
LLSGSASLIKSLRSESAYILSGDNKIKKTNKGKKRYRKERKHLS